MSARVSCSSSCRPVSGRSSWCVPDSFAAEDPLAELARLAANGFVPEQRRDVLTTTPTTLAAWAYAHLRD